MVYTQAMLHVFLMRSYSSDFSAQWFSSICTGHFTSLQNSLRLYSVKPSKDIFHRCATLGSKLISVVNFGACATVIPLAVVPRNSYVC